jgi:Uma2 family endonuclease
MTEPEFATFLQARENRWELLNGQPVMMAPTTQRHANIVANTLASLHRQLRGTGCRPTCSRTGVRTGEATIRVPDLVVDYGQREDQAVCATGPILVCEVLSQSRGAFDTHLRVLEYKTHSDITCVLLINPDAPGAILQWRDDAGWHDRLYNRLDQIVEFPRIGAAVPLRDVYDGCEFDQPDANLRGRPC